MTHTNGHPYIVNSFFRTRTLELQREAENHRLRQLSRRPKDRPLHKLAHYLIAAGETLHSKSGHTIERRTSTTN